MYNCFLYSIQFLLIGLTIVLASNATSKYMSYMAYTCEDITVKKLDNSFIQKEHFYGQAATIVEPGIYITNFALNKTTLVTKSEEPMNVNIKGYLVSEVPKVQRPNYNKRQYYSKAVNYYTYTEELTANYLPNIEYLTTNVQLALIFLPMHLIAVNGPVIPLADKPHEEGSICEIASWGTPIKPNNTLFDIEVKILPREVCRKELPEYNDTICFQTLYPDVDHCNVLQGGEPMFCNKELTGIVRSIVCSKGKPRPCASIFEHNVWITKWIQQFKDILLDIQHSNFRVKGDRRLDEDIDRAENLSITFNSISLWSYFLIILSESLK